MRAIVLLLAAVLCCGSVQGVVPQTINYQGYLTNAAGTPITGAVAITFRLYDAAVGGTLKWSETQSAVVVTNGTFDVVLGSVTAFPPLAFDAQYYVGITVGSDPEMTPRQALTAAPYALQAASAQALAPTAAVGGSQITGTIGTAQIANNAVTQAKLSSASGAGAGKVLGTDGTNLVWQTAVGGGTVTGVTASAPLASSGGTAPNISLTGSIPVANGGTGLTTLASNGILIGQGTGALATAVGAAGQVLAGAAGAPAWTDSPSLNGNLTLVESSASAGHIMKGTNPFIHNYGYYNTFIGENAGNLTMTGGFNSASGNQALHNNANGSYNTANGMVALYSNTAGYGNTASGFAALTGNTGGGSNTGSGAYALSSNVTGYNNTANGYGALSNSGKTVAAGAFVPGVSYTIQSIGSTDFTGIGAGSNTVGTVFAATGTGSGTGTASSNTTGNTASGFQALWSNIVGGDNTATGDSALYTNTTGSSNTASGPGALYSNATGNRNTASGDKALYHDVAGSDNIAIGAGAGYFATGDFNIDIGNQGVDGESNAIRIGDGHHLSAYVAGIAGAAVGASAVPVIIDSNSKLGTSGDVTINSAATITFGTTSLRTMLNLWNGEYGIGIQNYAMYFRSNGEFEWYTGGTHNDNIGNVANGAWLMQLKSGALNINGTVGTLSDRNAKENFAAIDPKEVLEKVASLPLQSWNYRRDDQKIRHLGPVAQDFYAAFAVGPDDQHIATVDESGVALAAIQGLNAKVEEQTIALRMQMAEKDARIAAQSARIDVLEKQVQEVAILKQQIVALQTMVLAGGHHSESLAAAR